MSESFYLAREVELRTESVSSPLAQSKNESALECKRVINALLQKEAGRMCTIVLRGSTFEFSSVTDISEYAGAMGIFLEEIAAALLTVQGKDNK